MAIADKLNELITQRNNLAANLNTMGVSASNDETLTTLVPKVLDIQTGGSSEITKGLVIKEVDENGYVIDAEIVGMTTIPEYYMAQYNNTYFSVFGYLSNIKIPNNVILIDKYAFTNCAKLKTINLPNTLSTIGSNAFQRCSSLELTELPSSVRYINEYAFNFCTSLSLTTLPDELTKIGNSVFASCTGLKEFVLPNSLTSIGRYAFENCSNLIINELPAGIRTIDNYCFNKCSKISEIKFLGDVSTIGTSSFNNCTNLTKIILPNVTKITTLSNKNAFTSTPIASGTGYIYVPDTLVENFKVASNWSQYASQIKGLSELEG